MWCGLLKLCSVLLTFGRHSPLWNHFRSLVHFCDQTSQQRFPPSSSLFILVDSAPLLPLFPLNCKAESNAITWERSSGRKTSQLITTHMLPNTRSLSASTPSNDLLRFLNARFWWRSARTSRRKTLRTVAAERRLQECNYMKTAAYRKTCRHALVCISSSPSSAIVCLGCCPPVVLMRVFSASFCCSRHTYKERAHGGGDTCLLSVCFCTAVLLVFVFLKFDTDFTSGFFVVFLSTTVCDLLAQKSAWTHLY